MQPLVSLARLAALAAVVALGACTHSPDHYTRMSFLNTHVEEALALPDRAVVFGSLGHTDMMNMAEPLIYFAIAEPPADANGRTRMSISDDMNLAGAWPGSYALAQLYMPANLQVYNFPGWDAGEARAVGRFDVAAGEVIYIGHLVFRAHGRTLDMTVEDRFEEFRRGLPPEIAARIQKRLIQVPASINFSSRTVRRVN